MKILAYVFWALLILKCWIIVDSVNAIETAPEEVSLGSNANVNLVQKLGLQNKSEGFTSILDEKHEEEFPSTYAEEDEEIDELGSSSEVSDYKGNNQEIEKQIKNSNNGVELKSAQNLNNEKQFREKLDVNKNNETSELKNEALQTEESSSQSEDIQDENLEHQKDFKKSFPENQVDESEQEVSIIPDIKTTPKEHPEEQGEFKKASTSINTGIRGDSIGHITPTTLDTLLGVVRPIEAFPHKPSQRPLTTHFGRKEHEPIATIEGEMSSNYIPTPSCAEVIDKFNWNSEALNTASQGAFKVIFSEITTLRDMSNIQAEKSITAALDMLKDPAAEGISPQESLALYVCEADRLNGRSVYQKLIEFGYLGSLLHPIANRMWGCVKYGHYYDKFGNNPLHLAAMSSSLQIVDFVLRLIKDPIEIKMALEEINITGQTPLDVAVEERRPSVIRRLKSTYRTMSNYVKKLDPKVVIEKKKRQKVMTENAALFCRPIIPITYSEQEAVEAIKIAEDNAGIIANQYAVSELSKPNAQSNIRMQKQRYQQKMADLKLKNELLKSELETSTTKSESIKLPNKLRVLEDNQKESSANDEIQKERDVIESAEDEGSQGLESIQFVDINEANNEDTTPSNNKEPSVKATNDNIKQTKPSSILEKVLFWSIIAFCIVFTIILLLIWFATKA
ncbi:uncharacterized protein CMU_016870 [Cryptosporidium muris RN66]|uniref:Uncharacterized protein n=1 Tax=Cryptosporidium muris (strain RN66) TaxID=441375 RepID=B6ACT2_CRYMR|nr:uncharacterized protein CMU_016870 [Cryptosporidium muris RN66]EEA05936.1 hypothetical protein, conserved [Cryptosporidium muris RN66]|eukprot:XP_002140285.1 hypothetical protein [Cryptosporidium muris RN66]